MSSACDTMTQNYQYLKVSTAGHVCKVTLNRADLHNAFNQEMIQRAATGVR